MRTVIETPTFQKQAEKIWSESERLAFIDWIAVNPLAGDVIPGADGARKVRWGRAGAGKRGGVRVVYFNLTEQGVVVLVNDLCQIRSSQHCARRYRKGGVTWILKKLPVLLNRMRVWNCLMCVKH
jgi:hypothetical protein